ncbi:bifunctional 3-deoxy-7-phosphoheptulonate synthase/chorismate mutase [Alkalihalobacillus sp. AL-G]|uniref:bifunctional 3-deoxy-7-phosphoheptulonate synthase/chorismate mutase n=1 Tax=Alkalihalobacillus sp. AL-G TaxID=2926399 RepID=UPI00272ADC93|nr:bifunctional 3-deoxy-7-phosphoheptulonate synthase/chorismate mutase [Alkalihalobacillus sp. AL-G]WLD92397.1 bifunctional 3-deoxy-7-phosphoheptulonate synthase/chorismate mutase [Alkalihalobacillus sp. AL-G]
MSNQELDRLRKQIDHINLELVELLNKRAEIVQEIGHVKKKQGINRFEPVRERIMLDMIAEHNQGPFETPTLHHLFKQIFKAGLELQEDDHSRTLLVSRKNQPENSIIDVLGETIGDGKQRIISGPCAVESYDQVDSVAEAVKKQGVKLLRGGAFKPRTSPYDFQGLGMEGLKILKEVAKKHDLAVVSEIVNPADLEEAIEYVDVIQIGARNMHNFELLKEAGKGNKPVLLKRGLAATISEFMNAAEYIMSKGNGRIILCERGIRTYENATRNTLDISAVPILKQETHLPVFVDVTHSTGRRDLLLPTAKASLAIGADGVMAEVHPDPAVALSDAAQQMDINQFNEFVEKLRETNSSLV